MFLLAQQASKFEGLGDTGGSGGLGWALFAHEITL